MNMFLFLHGAGMSPAPWFFFSPSGDHPPPSFAAVAAPVDNPTGTPPLRPFFFA